MSEEKRSGWYVLPVVAENLQTGEVYELSNIIPSFGPEHHPTPDCWCHPELEINNVLQHNVFH